MHNVLQKVGRWITDTHPHSTPTTLTPRVPLDLNFFTLSGTWNNLAFKRTLEDAKKMKFADRKRMLDLHRYYSCWLLLPLHPM